MNRAALCISALLCVISCSPPAESASSDEPTRAEDESAIRALRQAFNEAQRAGDVDHLATFYTDDAVVLGPDEPSTSGLDAIRAASAEFFESSEWNSSEPIEDLEVQGDLAFTRTTWSSTQTDKSTGTSVDVSGKAVHIYRRQPDGTWKIAVDIYNFDAPAETP